MDLRIENGIALVSSAVGVGCVYSSYNSYKANEKTKAMMKAAAAVAWFALAYQIIQISDPKYMYILYRSKHVSDGCSLLAPQTDGKECNIEEMRQYFEKLRDEKGPSLMEKYFIALENSEEGFSCENHIPLKDNYVGPTGYIDIPASDAPKALSWGYDFWRRAFIVMRYKCPNEEVKSFTIFQRYVGNGTRVATVGYNTWCLGDTNIIPSQPKYFSLITDFFQKRILVFKDMLETKLV